MIEAQEAEFKEVFVPKDEIETMLHGVMLQIAKDMTDMKIKGFAIEQAIIRKLAMKGYKISKIENMGEF